MPARLSRRTLLALAGASALSLTALKARAIIERPSSVFVWDGAGPFFGGFSAIELSADRTRALTISDRGFAVRVQLIRDTAGRLTAIEKLDHFTLNDRDGAPLSGQRADVEGMDQRPDGTLFLSFEGGRRSRVMHYPQERGRARLLPRHADWRNLPANGALEALAIDRNGTLFTIPENTRDGTFPIYRSDGGDWSIAGRLSNREGFEPVGADFGPDGNLYLLERKFRLAFFATRISRIRPADLSNPQTLVETSYGVLDNHEGISVTRDAAGQIWATTISDDNQNRFQRTEVAEFPLD